MIGNRYQAQSFAINVPDGIGYDEINISFPMHVSILAASWVDLPSCEGDEAELSVAPNTLVGTTTSASVVDSDSIEVSPTVSDEVEIGYYAFVDTMDMGRITEIDADSGIIRFENQFSSVCAPGSPVSITVMLCPKLILSGSGVRHVLGESRPGGSFIDAGTIIRARYNNLSGIAKKFVFMLEYLY